MNKFLIVAVAALMFCGQAFAYDKALAESYEAFFSEFEGKNMSQALRQVPASNVIEMIRKGEDIVIIDVRTLKEQSMIGVTYKNTLHIPMNEIFKEENLRRIPEDRIVILTCKGGLRCTIMALALHHAGFDNVYSMAGGVTKMNRNIGPATDF